MPADSVRTEKCVCGHEKVVHHGPGPCTAGYGTEKRKGMASVCPCVKYRPKGST